MTDRNLSERRPDEAEPTLRRPWTAPTLDVIAIADETEGPAVGFPNTDSITGIS